ncbi:hypothetical protein BJY01DRAFT_206745 [Aspergillus pseudoustus]|uniref:Major facilitator superfamily (MFS) profile domain-containing protein n=1 Tax=Aspergillus pseudoustus TaxID=1810923 RepID=A0ABR4KMH7_9EURO
MRPVRMAVAIILLHACIAYAFFGSLFNVPSSAEFFFSPMYFAEVAPTSFNTIEWRYYSLFILVLACGLP